MTDYQTIIKQITSLAEASSGVIPVMANLSALLFHAMEDINWAGFYLVEDGSLVVGPFQGKPACVRIERGRGVCGAALAEDQVQVVPDVHAFPGHIACDSASRSEIVLPVHRGGDVVAVLDIDGPRLSRFSEEDAAGLADVLARCGAVEHNGWHKANSVRAHDWHLWVKYASGERLSLRAEGDAAAEMPFDLAMLMDCAKQLGVSFE